MVGLERTFYNVSEGNEPVEICAIVVYPDIMCPVKFPFNLFFSVIEGTGILALYYVAIIFPLSPVPVDDSRAFTSLVSFDVCERSVCLNVSITDENFTFQLARTEGLDNRITLSPVAGMIINLRFNSFYKTYAYYIQLHVTLKSCMSHSVYILR